MWKCGNGQNRSFKTLLSGEKMMNFFISSLGLCFKEYNKQGACLYLD